MPSFFFNCRSISTSEGRSESSEESSSELIVSVGVLVRFLEVGVLRDEVRRALPIKGGGDEAKHLTVTHLFGNMVIIKTHEPE